MDLVRQLRKRRGWSQEYLAAASGVSRPTIQRIERGQVIPSPEIAMSLAAVLGVDASAIRAAAGLAARIAKVS
jgi:transcriptional regulator with XRE-family HTH domain